MTDVIDDVDVRAVPSGPKEVEKRLRAAARTLRRLPGERSLTARALSDVMQARGLLPSRDDDAPRRLPPTARAITLMEEALGWLSWLDEGDARIVMLRADELRWRQVAARVGLSRSTVCRRMAGAMVTIADKLARPEPRARRKAPPGVGSFRAGEGSGGRRRGTSLATGEESGCAG